MSGFKNDIHNKIVHEKVENPNATIKEIAKKLNLVKSTVCRVLKRFREDGTTERKKGSGRKPGRKDPKAVQNIKRSLKQNPGLSDQDRAKRYGVSKSTARRIRLDAGYNMYHVIKQPNRTEKQATVAKTRARRLYENVLTKHKGCLILDDETYVKCDFKQLPGQNYYSAQKRGDCEEKYKFKKQDKYGKKYMIWQCICSCGLKSEAFVISGSLTADIYITECLEKRLLPFIRKHTIPIVFWPDLASSHYSRKTLNWAEEKSVAFMPKEWNPPNSPQLRPIELFWAIMKRKLLKTKKTVKNSEEMLKVWNKTAETISQEVVQNLMSRITSETRKFIRGEDN